MADGFVRTFRFGITLDKSRATGGASSPDQLGNGGFQECSGLELEQDVQEYLEGGRNNGIVRRLGRVKYPHIVLKRGMFFANNQLNRQLWLWLQDMVRGIRPAVRYNGRIVVYHVGQSAVARWRFVRGLPLRIKGPELNAKTGEVAIEELQIAHEGLTLE
jgi:phage tail-like protein